MPKYVVLQVVLKEKLLGTGSGNLSELERVINAQAEKGYRLHTISTTSSGSKGLLGGDRVQATLVFESIIWNKTDKNLESIIELRNTSTHFITEDYELLYAPLFQACVYNYCDKMLDFHKVDIKKHISQNFLVLSVWVEIGK